MLLGTAQFGGAFWNFVDYNVTKKSRGKSNFWHGWIQEASLWSGLRHFFQLCSLLRASFLSGLSSWGGEKALSRPCFLGLPRRGGDSFLTSSQSERAL